MPKKLHFVGNKPEIFQLILETAVIIVSFQTPKINF